MLRLIATLALVALLGACGSVAPRPVLADLPTLRLSPASLGHALALQQRLQIGVGEHSQTLDALLEVDAHELRLGVQALGQSALTLRWDGSTLDEQRADWLPPTLRGDRVLFDLQLVFWPASEIRAALPAGWVLLDTATERRLLHGDVEVATVAYPSADRAVLIQLRDNYRLDVTSAPANGTAP